MEWIGAKIITTEPGIETLTGRFMELGINGFEVEDPRDFEEFLDNTVYYDYVEDELMSRREAPVSIKVYLPKNEQGAAQLAAMRAILSELAGEPGMGELALETEGIDEEDWAQSWKKYFKPINIGRRLVIKPSWEKIENAQGRAVLELDPSSSFGTGTHATTQLCLETMEKLVKTGDRVLDMGCGSGILGIGALLLGAREVVAVDIEENSVAIARENAAKNGFGAESFKTICGNILKDASLVGEGESFDLILANIVADVIIAMSPLFARFMDEGARVVTSGIIAERMGEVIDALGKNGLELTMTGLRDDWVSITAKRRG